MHWTLAITALLVAWAMIGGVWRRGSLALTSAWGLGQIVYVVTGNNLPISLYWIIDPIEETIEQYLLKEGKYRLHLKAGRGPIESQVIAGFVIDIRAVFEEGANLEALRKIVAQ